MSEEIPDINPYNFHFNRRGNMDNREDMPEANMHKILNDLARDQEELIESQWQMLQALNNFLGNNIGHTGHTRGHEASDSTQSNARTTSRGTPRPLMPQFLCNQPIENEEPIFFNFSITISRALHSR